MHCIHYASKVIKNWAQTQNRREAEAGQSIVIMVIGLIALLAFAGLVFDGGTAYAQFRRMQNAADAGALAAAQEVSKKTATSDRAVCSKVYDYSHERNGSPVYGRQSEPYFQVQYILKDQSLVELQNCDVIQRGEPLRAPPANAAGVRVTVWSQFDTFFLGIVGLHTGNVVAHASAEFGPAVPMVAQPLAKRCNGAPEDKCGLDKKDPQDIWDANSPGNFGWLSWTGDTDSGTIELELDPNFQITTYNDDITHCTVLDVGCWVQGSPGVKSSSGIKDKLDWWISSGTPMIIIIYDKEIEGGSNSDFHIIGFAAFKVVSYDLDKKVINGVFQDYFTASPVAKNAPDTGYYTVHLVPDIVSPNPPAPTKGKICVSVMNDLNQNGAVDIEDYFIAGATVTISGASGVVATWVSAGVSTNCVELMPGTYSVSEVNPTSPIALPESITPIDQKCTVNTPNLQTCILGAGVTKDVYFLDYVNPAQSGNVTVQVYEGATLFPYGANIILADLGGTVAGRGKTDGNGTYKFLNRPPGNYTVFAEDPPEYHVTTTNPVPATITAGTTVTKTFNVAYVPNGDICVEVVNDVNGNSFKDAGETTIGGAAITVKNASNQQVGFGTSSNSAQFCVHDLPTANNQYAVTEVNVAGYVSVNPDALPANVTNNTTTTVTFFDQLPPVGQICVLVFDDVTADGSWNNNELLGKDAVVNIIDWNNVVVGQWKTNGSEPHCYPNLPAGAYRVVETNAPGYTSTTADSQNVTVVRDSNTEVRFGDRMILRTPTPTPTLAAPTVTNTPPPGATMTPTPVPGALCVTVFEDLNNNGIFDNTPPAPPPSPTPTVAFTPELVLAPKDVTVLNSAGYPVGSWGGSGTQPYCFQNLSPGNYSAVETNAHGYGSTTADSVSGPVTSGNSTMITFGDILCLPTKTTMGIPYFDTPTNSWLLFWENVYADYYQLYGSATSIDPSQTSQWNPIATITGVNYSILQGTQYNHFYVTATNNCGTSIPSNVASLP